MLQGTPLEIPSSTWTNPKRSSTAGWQVDFVGSLPKSEGYQYMVTSVDTATGLFAAYPTCSLDQRAVIQALDHLCTGYGQPLTLESDNGTHFTSSLTFETEIEKGIGP